jgi:hypothetical protein
MKKNILRYSYWGACFAMLIAAFFLIVFAQQEVLDTGETSGEMPIEAGIGCLLIEWGLLGMIVGWLMKIFIYLKDKGG